MARPPRRRDNAGMTVEDLKKRVADLAPAELAEFGAWYEQFVAALVDAQLERDIEAGRFDELAAHALAEHAAGKTRPL